MNNKLIVDSQMIEIQCDRGDTATQQICYKIPYVHVNRTKTKFCTTAKNISQVLADLRGINDANRHLLPPKIANIMETQHIQKTVTKELLDHGPRRAPQPSDAPLMRHQQLGREIANVNPRFGFFYATRTGKTLMSLQIIVDDLKENPNHKWLILCPLILIDNAWLEDANKFFPDLQIVSLHGKTKADRMKKFGQPAQVYVQNIESFVTYQEEIEKLGIHGCFVDESSTMKSTKSKFAKAAVEFSVKVKRWYLLSGTPAPNTEAEYYMQLKSIDYFSVHPSMSQFENYFFDNTSYNPQFKKLKLKDNKKDEFNTLLKSVSMYVDSEDVLELPGRSFDLVPVVMPKDVQAHYKTMKNDLCVEFASEDLTITAPSAAAKLNKLRQISSGFIYDEDGNTTLISMYKFDALMNLLASIGDKQVLIWANYRYEFDVIKSLLGDNCSIINGSVGITEKNQAIQDFKAGKIQYLIANPASLDKGVTLTNAHNCVYFSVDYSYERYEQSIARIYGGKHSQKEFCRYYILQVEKSIEPIIYNAVVDKKNVSMEILNYLRWSNG